jgi:Tol biopolymer transport system component
MGIQDFHVSLDGDLLIFSAHASGGGTELRVYDLISKEDRLLLACEAEKPCGGPALSPDGKWLAFERVEYAMGAAGRLLPSITRVWVMPFEDEGQAVAVSPAEHTARNPSWAPTNWLIYFDDRLKALALMNPAQGLDSAPFNYIPTNLGLVGSWSPEGTRLMYPDIVFADEQAFGEQEPSSGEAPLYYSHLYMMDVTSGRVLDASPGEDWMVEDASPSFSSDGRWVAFTRKFLDAQRWTPGRQLWLMNSERTTVQRLSDDPGATFSSLAWSPDSQRLAYMRRDVADLSRPSEIWWVDVISGVAVKVVEGGYLPQWIP